MALLQAAVIGLIALILAPGYIFYFDVTPKLVILLTGTALVLSWAATGLRLPPKPFTVVVLLMAASLGISALTSVDPTLSVYGTVWRRFGLLAQVCILLFAWMIAAHNAGRPGRVRIILRGIAISGAICAIYGICQYAGWDPILNAASYHIGAGRWTIVRPPGTLGYVSYFAAWLLSATFLAIALAGMEVSRWWKRVAYASAALSAVAIVLSGTRAALLGLAAGAAAGLYARSGLRISRRHVAITGLVLIAAIAFWYSPAGWPLHSRLRWFIEDPWGGARPLLWRDSLRMAIHRPILGWGPEVFQGVFPHYESASLARAYPDFTHESPHNMFIDVLIAQGIPGLMLLVLFCRAGLRRAQPWLTASIAAAVVCQQFIVFSLPTALLFYSTIALSVAMASPEAAPQRSRLPVIACTLAAAGLFSIGVLFTAADRHLALVSRDLSTPDLQKAAEHYSAYERLQPGRTTADLWYSRALLDAAGRAASPVTRIRLLACAAQMAERATKTSGDPFDAWYQLALLYALQNNAAGSEKSLRFAIAEHPVWFKPHWVLARLLASLSRHAEAEREAARAVYLDNDKHPEVLQTLNLIRAQGSGTRASALQK